MKYVDLPDIQFTEQEVAAIRDAALTTVERKIGRTMNRADPERILFLALIDIIIQQRVLIDRVKKSDLLKYASGGALDHLGALFNVYRLDADAATTTLRFTLSIPLTTDTIIPSGTRVAVQDSGGAVYFSTEKVAVITAGNTTVDVAAVANEAGEAGNGYIPGQINAIMDPLPYVQSAVNVTESSGGNDEEDDDALRERIRMSPESFSTAGPGGAYEYWAKTASSAIADVYVTSPAVREVLVVPLLENGAIPGQDVLDTVAATLNDRTVRPITDKVTVQAPETVLYNINLTYYISDEDATKAATIQEAVTAAVADYVLWQKSKLGRHINPSQLIKRVIAAGALRADVTEPVYTELAAYQVAQEGTVNTAYGGLEDD
ncbi:baseplate J/gp47 family protein [Paenibacillus sp. 3LSP]|uniref:baseplate assembly protein n=1 Tax=Paenibacillus sp. 3LSP TaxID=2800795 RepID=UPI0028FD0B52|nr:baseplate J/gp47 family protein [Paenibacillus sp. 3LSP]MDU0332532.1 baseplate J/gp47 family protein [Paenibacillus sp. 3LSP]